MSLRATSLALLLLSVGAPARAEEIWGVDKAEHLFISLGLGGACYTGLRLLGSDPPAVRLTLSVGLALAPGLAKELWDSGRPGNHFSGLDLAWDFVGAVSGALLAFGVDLLIARLRRAPARPSAFLDIFARHRYPWPALPGAERSPP